MPHFPQLCHPVAALDPNQGAVAAARAVAELLTLLTDEGLPLAAVLAGAHAEIVARMVIAYGAEEAIASMVRAADRIEGLPSAAAAALAGAEVAGHA